MNKNGNSSEDMIGMTITHETAEQQKELNNMFTEELTIQEARTARQKRDRERFGRDLEEFHSRSDNWGAEFKEDQINIIGRSQLDNGRL